QQGDDPQLLRKFIHLGSRGTAPARLDSGSAAEEIKGSKQSSISSIQYTDFKEVERKEVSLF
ncbi:MAG: hypothetical protein QGH11_07610, partial [Pirellulaceae bacterium]|nr:hypothetical protein [Pirellulaceae bacterium]